MKNTEGSVSLQYSERVADPDVCARKEIEEGNQEGGVMVEGGLPGGGPVSSCPGTRLWGPLPLVQAAGRWVQSPGSQTLGTESRQLDAGCRVQAARH